MSYILDALRRADAERERESSSVPGLHAQPVPLGSNASSAKREGRPWLWLVIGASLTLLAPLVWRMFDPEPAPPPLLAETPPAMPPQVVPPAPPMAEPPPPAPSMQTAPEPVETAPTPARRTVQAARAPVPKAIGNAGADTSHASTKPNSNASSADARVYAQNELPDEIRRQLPALTIGGSIYSETPANRFLIINGQLFHERDKIAPDLSLEQIKLKAAVLKFKGYRYGITY